jgi:hypothetical protein
MLGRCPAPGRSPAPGLLGRCCQLFPPSGFTRGRLAMMPALPQLTPPPHQYPPDPQLPRAQPAPNASPVAIIRSRVLGGLQRNHKQ